MKRWTNLASLLTRGRPPVGTTPADVVHAENKWKLLRYRRSSPAVHPTPVLLVPSLINRHYVLDLLPGKSFAGWLVEQGFDVFCIDWGTPGPEDRFLTFDELCDGYLGRALRKTGAPKAHVLGYCMGGTLAAIHAARHPERFASLIALAAPVRFEGAGILGVFTQSRRFDPKALVSALGNVPAQLLQATFKMQRPTLDLAKAVSLVDRAWDDEFLDGFLATETWGSDNVAFPGEVWRTWVEELYRRDAFVSGELSLGGRPVRLEDVTCPLLVVTFEHDTIVPRECALPLLERATSTDKVELRMAGGHVGAVVSRGAVKKLWPSLAGFWAQREATPPRAANEAASARKARNGSATHGAAHSPPEVHPPPPDAHAPAKSPSPPSARAPRPKPAARKVAKAVAGKKPRAAEPRRPLTPKG